MNTIEQMLTGQMEMSEFVALLKSDRSIQETIRCLVPKEAIGKPDHAFWKCVSYEALKERGFDYLKFLFALCRFDRTIGDDLNIWGTIQWAYRYYYPELNYTGKYDDAHGLYLNAAGEYYEGPEVMHILNQVIVNALPIKPKSKRIKEVREKLAAIFHVVDKKRPRWIQGAEWPMGKNSPMQYIGRARIPDGVQYTFQDVDTGEIRVVEQFY